MNANHSNGDMLVISGYFPVTTSSYCPFVYDQVHAFAHSRRFEKIYVVNPSQAKDYTFREFHVIGSKCNSLACRLPIVGGILQRHHFMKVLAKHSIDLKSLSIVYCHQRESAEFGLGVKKRNPAIRVLVQFHDGDPFRVLACGRRFSFLGLKQLVCFLNSRRILEKVDACVAVSKNIAKMAMEFPLQSVYLMYEPAVKWGHRLRRFRPARIKKMFVLHNGVDTAMFNPQGRIAHSGFHVGCFATCIPLKGYRYLIEAMSSLSAQLGDWRMTLIGSGPELNLYKDYVKASGIAEHVRFLSGIEHETLADYFRELDLFVMPSYFEAFGCVYSEAFACGTPYIACEDQGIEDVIYPEDRHLWLTKPKNSQDLAQKILFYYKCRPVQRVRESVDIDVLVGKFLEELFAWSKQEQ